MSITSNSKSKPKGLLYIIQDEKVYSASSKTRRLYLTKFMENDIKNNKDYLYGRWQGRFGYIRLKGVKELIYKPNLWINHVFKDDSLYVSFHKEPMITQSDSFGSWYSGYDFCINGMDMVQFLYHCDYNEEDKKILMDAFEDKIDYYNKKFIDDLTYAYVSKSILPWVN